MIKIDESLTISLPAEEKKQILNTAGKMEIPVSQFCRKAIKQKIQAFNTNEKFENDNLSFFDGGL